MAWPMDKRVGLYLLVASAVARPEIARADALELPARAEAQAAPASLYANLTSEEAIAELLRRKIPFEAAEAPGVRDPIRLSGPLHGVVIHSSLPAGQRKATPFEI